MKRFLFIAMIVRSLLLYAPLGCETGESLESDFGDDEDSQWSDSSQESRALGPSVLYQAESYTAQSGCVLAKNTTGYTGTGFMDYGGNGSFVEFNNVNVAAAGKYSLTLRYGNGGVNSRQAAVIVNGVSVGNVPFTPTGQWSTWSTANITALLRAGKNTIRISASTSTGGPNLDRMEVTPVDLCASDATKTEPGQCGCGVPEGTCGYQAESYTTQNGCVLAATHAGFTGAGFMDYGGSGTFLEWNNVTVKAAGTYTLTFRYAVASGTRQCAVLVNGANIGNVPFSSTGAWTTWKTVTVRAALKAGNNTVRVLANTASGGPNLDKMELDTASNDTDSDTDVDTDEPTVPDVQSEKIVYPWRATTSIVKAGESFEVWFNATNTNQTLKSVQLRGPYNTVSATHKIVTGSWVYDQMSGRKYNTRITVTVPANAPADRYDLVLKTSTVNEVSTGAVKVIKEYKDSYYVVHFSDVHRFQSGYDENTTFSKVSAILDIANIIDAEMVFETGDGLYCHTENPSVTTDRVNAMFGGKPQQGIKGLHGTKAATFFVPGNHDSPSRDYTQDENEAETATYLNQYIGLQSYNFKYGNGRYMGVNSGMGPVPDSQTNAAVSW